MTFPGSPRLKGGIVLIDTVSAAVQKVMALQYNPDSLSRTLQVRGAGKGATVWKWCGWRGGCYDAVINTLNRICK